MMLAGGALPRPANRETHRRDTRRHRRAAVAAADFYKQNAHRRRTLSRSTAQYRRNAMEHEQINTLAGAFQNGDLGSFKKLVESLTRPLIAVAYRYTQNWDSAQDICQETWIKVYENIHRYDPARPFKTWLFAVHRNGCLTHLRSAAAWKHINTDDPDAYRFQIPDDNPGPAELLERKEFGARLRRAMSALTKQQRLVFAVVDLEQTGQDEAALKLGMKHATLRTTLHFARKRLARMLRTTEERS
jgi:RNA polymerase sigma-70 factor (ECF subfamily)